MMTKKKQAKKRNDLAERLEAIREEADKELDRLAEERRPESVPAGWMRLNWLARANGNIYEACLAAIREGQ